MCPLHSRKIPSSFSFCCDSSFQSLHISCAKGQREDLNEQKPPQSIKVRRGEDVFFHYYVINDKLILLQFSQNVHNPKQWSPSLPQLSEVRFPSPLSEPTGTLTPVILESTLPKLPVLWFRASTTACRQTTPTQVPCGYCLGKPYCTVLFRTARL